MSKKFQDIGSLLFTLGILILVNVIGSFLFHRFDMTEDQRYSLSEETRELVENMEDMVHFRIYLDGDLPPSLDRLKQATKEMLDELRAYQPKYIQYEFIDPSAIDDEEKRRAFYRELRDKGLKELIIQVREKGSRGEKILFPGAVVSMGQEVVMELLGNRVQRPSEEAINKAIGNLEYKFAHTIRKLQRGEKPQVGILSGHGELGGREIYDAVDAMKNDASYAVDTVEIDGRLNALKDLDALLVAKPEKAFSDKDKFILDQFIMNGGRVMWLVDPMQVSMDSLERGSTTMAIPYDLNIDDLLFTYGVRLNKDLVMDRNCANIGIVTNQKAGQPRIEQHPWYFYPTSSANGIEHPISSNIDPVRLKFVSTLDTVGRDSVKQTVLLNSSDQVRVLPSPARVSLNVISIDPGFERSNEAHRPLSVLLEGNFRSFFEGRIPPKIEKSEEIGFRERSKETRMMVVGDGDLIKNRVDRDGQVYPLGYDKYQRRRIYGNKDFIMNGMEYLLAEGKHPKLRSGVTLRKLDPGKTEGEDRYYWQVVNVSVPIVLVILFGALQHYLRRKLYMKTA